MIRMRGLHRSALVTAAAGAALLLFAAVALAGSGFKNGNFETGDFSKWSTDFRDVCPEPAGWFVSDKKITPVSGNSWFGPAEKEFAAVTDQVCPSASILYRTIKIGSKNTRVSFILYYKNRADLFCSQNDLDETNPCNQEYRVEILRDGSDPWTTDPNDILMTLFKTSSSSPFSLGPTKMTFGLGKLSGNVILRFAMVDTEFYFNASVDNVQVNNG